MPKTTHTEAAEHHEKAAKSHRTAVKAGWRHTAASDRGRRFRAAVRGRRDSL